MLQKLSISTTFVLLLFVANLVKSIFAFVAVLSCPLLRLGAISHTEVFQVCLFTPLSLCSAVFCALMITLHLSHTSLVIVHLVPSLRWLLFNFRGYPVIQEHFMSFTLG